MSPKKLALPTLSSLKPFRSFLFLKLSDGTGDGRVAALRNAIATMVRNLSGAGEPVASPRSKKGDLYSAFAVYVRERRVPWTSSSEFVDVEHHLLVVSGYKDLLAVFMSDVGLREAVRSEIAEETDALVDVELIPTNKLNAVFVKGRARTLWLNNVQRRSSLKADHKVLSGISLQDALDPLGDQSYTFTAARCQNDVAENRSTYGVAPGKSRLWFKPSKSWDEYTKTVTVLLRALDESTDEEAAPLPVLSVPIQGKVDVQTLGAAYEMSLLPLELANPAEDAEVDLTEAELVPDLAFEVADSALPLLSVSVASEGGGQALGHYLFEMAIDHSGRVEWTIKPEADGTPDTADMLNGFSRRLNVSFEGGFAISDGAIHSVRYRDLPFGGFSWMNFAGTDIRKEKPNPLSPETIGAQDSLFCWVRNQWALGHLPWLAQAGWLASNDGATEIADFIHLQEDVTPTLTLVHVKAATSSSVDRGLSVVPYEVVVSQAIKNLRHVDPQLAAAEFTTRVGRQVRDAVWRNGVVATREEMLAAIQNHGANLARRVVVIQPQTRRQAHVEALQRPEGSRERHLVRQLNTLLFGAQRDCSGMGAEFVVVAQEA